MNRTTSLYLDLMRLATALIVFLVHANYGRFTGGLPVISHLKFLANDGVMVFFVLSGFVIAYVAENKEFRLTDYAISRLARLYSVVVPAIVLTIILDYIGSSIDYKVYDGWWFQYDNPVWRISASLFFVNELWFSSVRLFSNGPFWSLGYEFWYYVIFGAAYYLRGSQRYFAVSVAMLIAGPKVLLLFPVWLLGAWTYRATVSTVVPEFVGWFLYLGSVVSYILFQNLEIPRTLLEWSNLNLNAVFAWNDLKWSFAASFLGNYALGIMVSAHMIGFVTIAHRFAAAINLVGKYIHYMAGFTFAIYLFHYPLLQFITAITGGIADVPLRNTVIVLGTLAAAIALGTVTEMRKAELKRMMLFACASIRGPVSTAPPV